MHVRFFMDLRFVFAKLNRFKDELADIAACAFKTEMKTVVLTTDVQIVNDEQVVLVLARGEVDFIDVVELECHQRILV